MDNPHWGKGEFYCQPRGMELFLHNIYEYIVLSRLIDRADDDTGVSFPSYRDLTMGLMSRTKAIESVEAIRRLAIISIQHVDFKSNRYTIHWDRLKELMEEYKPSAQVRHGNQSPMDTSTPQQPTSTQDGRGSTQGGRHMAHPNETHSKQNPLTKPINEKHADAASLNNYFIENWDGAYGLDCEGQWLKFIAKYPPETITDGKALIDKWFENLKRKSGNKESSEGGEDRMEGLESI